MARKINGPQIVTANQLTDGLVVYLTSDGRWSAQAADAAVAADADAAGALLALGEADAAAARVVAPYLIEVDAGGDAPVPRRYREVIRARGPSVRTDLGYQSLTGER